MNRDSLGFIELNKISKKGNIYFFEYLDKIYFYKPISQIENVYNELIASELAKDYNINCLTYDIASYDETIGVISENFIKENQKYISIEEILINVYGNNSIENKNNLEDIWYALDIFYKNPKITKKLMDNIIDIFIFDILIGNIDRHSQNYGFIEINNTVEIAPLFDNEKMLNENSIYYGDYSIGIDKSDYSFLPRELDIIDNYIYKFIRVSDSSYFEKLKEKLEIISNENINSVIKRVEKKINSQIPDIIKNKIIKKFDVNRKMITNICYLYKTQKVLCK